MSAHENDNILIVWDRIGDYHRARLRALEELVGEQQVFSADLGAADELYGWDNTTTEKRHFVLSGKPVQVRDAMSRLKAFRSIIKSHDIRRVAIAGYGRVEYILFILYARLKGCRVTLFAESWYGKNRIKNWIKGWFLRVMGCGFLVSGERCRDHFHKKLGIPKDRIFTGYSVVDNEHFAAATRERENILLCVARFSPEKNLKLLIRAFLQSTLKDSCRLRLIGGGPQEDELRREAGNHPGIDFVGWVNYQSLPGEYARAGYFILPSTFEPWGLVVNEAMAAGLPVIVSDACGCQPELVGEDNGYVFAGEDASQLVGILDNLPGPGSDPWRKLSDSSRIKIDNFTCRHWAEQLVRSFR